MAAILTSPIPAPAEDLAPAEGPPLGNRMVARRALARARDLPAWALEEAGREVRRRICTLDLQGARVRR